MVIFNVLWSSTQRWKAKSKSETAKNLIKIKTFWNPKLRLKQECFENQNWNWNRNLFEIFWKSKSKSNQIILKTVTKTETNICLGPHHYFNLIEIGWFFEAIFEFLDGFLYSLIFNAFRARNPTIHLQWKL